MDHVVTVLTAENYMMNVTVLGAIIVMMMVETGLRRCRMTLRKLRTTDGRGAANHRARGAGGDTMPRFGNRSFAALETCVGEIIMLAEQAIKVIDFSVLVGHRTNEEQDRLYAIGRTTPGRIVTYKKGGESHHNESPSPAMDFVPYPIDWEDLARFGVVAGVMKHIAFVEGIDMTWGGDWTTLRDYPHIQVVDYG